MDICPGTGYNRHKKVPSSRMDEVTVVVNFNEFLFLLRHSPAKISSDKTLF